jgi:DNA polymerase/3'-5' exonuclease PolX
MLCYMQIYPRSQRAFALFYFTGSDAYNRGVRYYASKNGYALDDKVSRQLRVCARSMPRL